ncbi:MAG: divalent metal cation transporter [Micrococcaceae bacterium]
MRKISNAQALPTRKAVRQNNQSEFKRRVKQFALVAGPGIAVMLADTDAGSLITAAQSGAQWGYTLLSAQIILIPIVFIAQELTVRLGLVTGKGHGELIKETFGKGWAWFSVTTLSIACAGAIVSEMSGISGVGELWGIPSWISTGAVALFLIVMVVTGSYKRVERVAIGIGLFELVFLITMFMAKPQKDQIAAGLSDIPIHNSSYVFLIAANIGAVIMPWMIFYQQSAVVDKGLTVKHLKEARADTAFGAIVTQTIMAAMLITCASALWATNQKSVQLNTVQDIATAITPHLGEFGGKVLFSLGMIGASLIAAIVASLTAAWGIGEVSGYKRSLEHKPSQAPAFYAVFSLAVIFGFILVETHINIILLNLFVQVMNALLLPIVLGFLFLLALKSLPEEYKLKGWYAWFVGAVIVITAGFGVYCGIAGIAGGGS